MPLETHRARSSRADAREKTNLIVAPLALLEQWKDVSFFGRFICLVGIKLTPYSQSKEIESKCVEGQQRCLIVSPVCFLSSPLVS